MPRIANLAETGILTAETQIKIVPGYVFSITIGYAGCAEGDIITLRDSASGVAAGHDEVVFVLPTDNGTMTKEWPEGKEFTNGIFLNFHNIVGAKPRIEMTYK